MATRQRELGRPKKPSSNGFQSTNPLAAELAETKDKLVSKATLTELRAACCPYNVIVQTAVEVCI